MAIPPPQDGLGAQDQRSKPPRGWQQGKGEGMAVNYARILWFMLASLWDHWKLYNARHWIGEEIERRANARKMEG